MNSPKLQIEITQQKTLTEKKAYRISEAAQSIGVADITVRRAVYEGLLPAKKWGTSTIILREDLEEFLNKLPAAE